MINCIQKMVEVFFNIELLYFSRNKWLYYTKEDRVHKGPMQLEINGHIILIRFSFTRVRYHQKRGLILVNDMQNPPKKWPNWVFGLHVLFGTGPTKKGFRN